MQPGLVTAMVILDLLLVFLNLAVQLVEQGIDSGVEIITGLFDVDVLARYVQRNFAFLFEFFN